MNLLAPDGTTVATYVTDDAGGADWVIVTALARPVAEVAPVLLASFPGHRVVTEDGDLVGLLVAGGGRIQRRGHDYEYDLRRVPPEWAESPAPQGFRLGHDIHPNMLAAAHDAANPPDHPDHETGLDHEEDLRAMVEGRVIGPLVGAASWQVTHATDGPCGAILVVDRGPGRAWVVDVFVHPKHQRRGLGGLLLRRSLAGAAAAGYDVVGLVVSDGNPARAAYDAVGFTLIRSGTNVDLPR